MTATTNAEADLLQLTLSRLGVGTIVTSPEGLVESLSPFAERLTGWNRAEAHGQPVEKVFRLVRSHVAFPDEPDGATALSPAGGRLDVAEAILVSRDGKRVAIEHTVAPIRGARGRIERITFVFHDVSQRNLASLQLARQSTHDPLTGLLNRHAFASRVEKALAELRQRGRPLAVCQIDIDQFNLVNNSCGHGAGDDLLQWTAAILREETGESDVVARLGGDVFAVLLQRDAAAEPQALAEALLRRLRTFEFSWEDKTFPVGACIGLVPIGAGSHAVAEVVAAADHACSLAKAQGRNQIRICRLEDEELALRRQEMDWVARIRKHLHDGGVSLYAQPIRHLARRGADECGFEVLLRMTTPGGDAASAGRMIQAAERYGLMGAIDRWVIRGALQELRRHPRRVIDRLRLCCINISRVSLHDRSILEFIHQQLAASKLPPAKVCFELTETAAVENLPQARWLIGELQAIGCRFALDDFGSGLASFAHLRELPVGFLKIAGAFVETLACDPLSQAMVESITQIARVLGCETIAESVSSQAALEAVEALGVDYAQGNWVGAPLPLAVACAQS
ncbi:MAG TPA: EAL domain-containing protein [Thermoanaerobaculaceae bacterium]|nr:EAL domain-containing protein [Thermoanaerobaculaceae bacterium]